MRRKLSSIGVFGLTFLVLLGFDLVQNSSLARNEPYTPGWVYAKPTEYPRRVSEIRFFNRAVINRQYCINWGSHKACFKSELPIARFNYYEAYSKGCNYISIEPLICENGIGERNSCYFEFQLGTPTRNCTYRGEPIIDCYLSFLNGGRSYAIGCPEYLFFD